MSNEPAPEFLADAGRAVWSSIVGKYGLRPDELRTLEDACAISDIIAMLSSAWDEEGKPLTTKGSMGQLVIHPLIGEIRAQRAARNALWRQLKLPDDVGSVPGSSEAARGAANSRWSRGS